VTDGEAFPNAQQFATLRIVNRLVASLLLSTATASVLAAPAVGAPTWSPASTVEWLHDPAKVDLLRGSLQVAADAQGNEVAAWLDSAPDGRWAVTVSSRAAAGSWGPATRFFIAPPRYEEEASLKLDVSSTGWAVVSWIEPAGTGGAPQSRFVTRSPGGTWSQPATSEPALPAGSTGTEYFSSDIGPSGELSLTWLRSEATAPDGPVLGRKLRVAGASTFVDDPLVAGYWSQPQFDAAGNALVIDNAPNGGLISRWRSATGDWEAPQQVAPPSDEAAGLGDIGPTARWAIAPNGAATAIWLRPVDGQVGLQAARRSADGTWGPVTTLDRFAEFPTSFLTGYDVSAGPAGAVVGWSLLTLGLEGGASTSQVFGTVAGPTGGFGARAQLAPTITNPDPASGNSCSALQTAVGDRVGVVTWSTAAGVAAGAQFTAGQSSWSAPFALPTAGKATNLGATFAPNDRLSVIWGEADRLRWSTAALGGTSPSPTPTPTPTPAPAPARTVRIDAALSALSGARCPSSAQVAVNGKRVATLPITGAGAPRCRVTGTVPVSSSLKAGTSVIVTITATGLVPAVLIAKVA
jgi:hypothetical protein